MAAEFLSDGAVESVLGGAAGDDVDDAAHGAGALEAGGALDDLDAVDAVERESSEDGAHLG